MIPCSLDVLLSHFSIILLFMSGSNCCFLTCIQVSQAGKLVWFSRFLKNFPQFVVIHTAKDSGVVNEAEVDVFLQFPCFFYDPTNGDNLISCYSVFSKSSLYIWEFSVHILLKPSLKDFEHYIASMWNECSCWEGWTFFWYCPSLGLGWHSICQQIW